MKSVEIEPDKVETSLLGLRTKRTKNSQGMPNLTFAFRNVADERIDPLKEFLTEIGFVDSTGLFRRIWQIATGIYSRNPSYKLGNSTAFFNGRPTHAMIISGNGLSYLENLAMQFLLRQKLDYINVDNDRPEIHIALPYGDELRIKKRQIETACHLLGLEYTVDYSSSTKGRAVQFKNPEDIQRIQNMMKTRRDGTEANYTLEIS